MAIDSVKWFDLECKETGVCSCCRALQWRPAWLSPVKGREKHHEDQKRLFSAWAGNQTRASRVEGKNSNTEPPMLYSQVSHDLPTACGPRQPQEPVAALSFTVPGPWMQGRAGGRKGHGESQLPTDVLLIMPRPHLSLQCPRCRGPHHHFQRHCQLPVFSSLPSLCSYGHACAKQGMGMGGGRGWFRGRRAGGEGVSRTGS